MDLCDYRLGEGPVRAFLAGAAGEFRGREGSQRALEKLDTRFFPVEKTSTGAETWQMLHSTARHSRVRFWKNARFLMSSFPRHTVSMESSLT
ncbi:hypothetical protein FJTKL_15226 [Diaporthe vaccinii]|uniref:Uncharacterized protein n=1 Tax=Diaporthe vaccinii TaxID=105482 RepID=A0ABR4E5U0_9PEZI